MRINRKDKDMVARMSSPVQAGNENKDIRAMVLNSFMKNPARGGKYSAAL